MGKRKELAKNTIIIFLGKACTQFISILLLPLYTKFLITEEYGLVDLVTTYISLVIPVLSLQLEMAAFRFLLDSRKNKEKNSKIISTIFWILVLLSIVAVIGYSLITYYFVIKYKYVIAAVILVCFFSQYFMQIARGLGKNVIYSIACCVTGIFTVVLNVILIVGFKMKADGMLYSMIIANICSIIFLIISLDVKNYISIKFFDKYTLKRLLKYSIPLIPNGISWWVVNASDRTIILAYLGVTSNGIYAVSNKFSSLFIGIFNVFSISWTETVSLHINDENSSSFFSEIMNGIIKLFISICMAVVAFMPIIFYLFIDKNYEESYNNIPILIYAMLFNIVVGLYSSLYIAKKMTKQVMNTSIVSAIINIVLNIMFVKYIGLYAASMSTLIAYAVMAIYRYYDFKKVLDIKWDFKNIIKSVVVSLFVTFLYYQKNIIANIIMILIAIIYFIVELLKIYPLINSHFIKRRKI